VIDYSAPFDTSDDPNATAALPGRQYLMLLLVALMAVSGCVLVLLGALRDRPPLRAAGSLSGSRPACCCPGWAAASPPVVSAPAAPS
jgi:hypothetical protein